MLSVDGCVWVTRPQPQADEWVAQLQAQGWPAQAFPLIDIRAPHDRRAVHAAWHALPDLALVMFVSPSAVRFFFGNRPVTAFDPTHGWPSGLTVAATGPGTARALLAGGVPPAQIVTPDAGVAQFDSETLWPLLASWRGLRGWQGTSTLIVRGSDDRDGADAAQGTGRHWLGEQLCAAGARVDYVAAYCRAVPVLTPVAQGLLCRAVAGESGGEGRQVWLLSSSQAVDHLLILLRSQSLAAPSVHLDRALATHPRIAQAAKAAGFAHVLSTQPTLPAVIAALRAWA